MVSVEYDGRATDDVVFDELVQIAVCLIEGDEVCVGWEAVEEVEQRQPRDAYTVFKYIDVLVVVECGLFYNGFEEWRHVTVVIPHEVVAHRCHFVIAPHHLATSVVLVGDAFAREATEEGRLRRQSAILQLTQVVHVFIGKVTFLLRATYAVRYFA